MKYAISILLLYLLACQSNNKPLVSTEDVLPFFNQPDWTPEWISEKDSAYRKIHTIPAFTLLNQDGDTVTANTLSGKIYVANFFFSRCNNICPKMTNNMHVLQDAYAGDKEVMLLSHSVTPEDDSIPALKHYAAEHQVDVNKWLLLTGDKDKIYTLAKKQYFAGDSIGYYQSGNEFLHTENFILIDKKKRIRGVYNGTLPIEIERIKKDIATLKAEG